MKKKKEKIKYIDDERTIADMNVEGFRWYVSNKVKAKKAEINELKLTKRERFAMMKAALLAIIPLVMLLLFGFFIIAFVIFIWLY